MAQEKNGVVIICIELTKGEIFETAICMGGWNNWQGVERSMFFLLEQLARSGKIDVLLAGPPCRSVSVCRLRSLEGDDGPRVVRMGMNDLAEVTFLRKSSNWFVMATCFGCGQCG